jgi:2-amino-4-hydroxy-6-hydroxymethyldihydropteridine diphosphokinase
MEEPNLTIPHPHLHQRRFTLVPLVEIDENWVHPKLNKTMQELLESCEDKLSVEKISIK